MKKIFWIIKLLIIIGMFVTAYYFYPAMPEKFPTHWNFDGNIDGYSSKVFGVYLFPVLTLAIAFLMPLVRYMDPRKERFKQFEKPWEVIQFILVLFLAYMFFVMLYIVAHPGVSMNPFMMMGMGILFVLLGNYLGKIRQNYTIGIRVPWTIDNEEVWNKTHRLGGWCFVIAGLIFMINASVNFMSWLIFLIAIILAAGVPIIYSYIIFRQLKK
jgi:uncharacterized membrane protein